MHSRSQTLGLGSDPISIFVAVISSRKKERERVREKINKRRCREGENVEKGWRRSKRERK